MLIHCENDKCKHYFEDGCMENTNNKMVSIDNTGRCMTFEKGKNESYDDSEKVYKLTKEEVLAMLPDKEYIHTFRQGSIGLVGCDWPRKEIIEMMDKFNFELTGEQATSMGHGMAFKDELGWLFIETK